MRFVQFSYQGIPTGQKTGIWRVMAQDNGAFLGKIKWFGRWRKYCFFPSGDTVFEEVCLRDIAKFVESETRKHRALRAA
jgi:hypothetical protein